MTHPRSRPRGRAGGAGAGGGVFSVLRALLPADAAPVQRYQHSRDLGRRGQFCRFDELSAPRRAPDVARAGGAGAAPGRAACARGGAGDGRVQDGPEVWLIRRLMGRALPDRSPAALTGLALCVGAVSSLLTPYNPTVYLGVGHAQHLAQPHADDRHGVDADLRAVHGALLRPLRGRPARSPRQHPLARGGAAGRAAFAQPHASPRSCRRFCRRRACFSWSNGSAIRKTAAFSSGCWPALCRPSPS